MKDTKIFEAAARRIQPVMLIISFIVLIRGHNEPGGGFIGGLIAAGGYVLLALSVGSAKLHDSLPVSPPALMGFGLIAAIGSGFFALVNGGSFMEGQWIELKILSDFKVKLGTPLLFDVGVYLVVIGFTLKVMIALMEEWEWN